MDSGTQGSMRRPSLAVVASSLAILGGIGGGLAEAATVVFRGSKSSPDFLGFRAAHSRGLAGGGYLGGSRGGGSTFVNRGLPGHFQKPPRPRKRCQRRGRR